MKKIDPKLNKYIKALGRMSEKELIIRMIKLGADIELVSKKNQLLKIKHKGKKKYMILNRFYFNTISSIILTKNKELTKIILEDNNFSIPRGITASDFTNAKRKIKDNGIEFPLVIKPLDGIKSKGVFMNIENFARLQRSIVELRNKFIGKQDSFIVEEVVPGNNFRISVLNGKMIACAQRIPAHIVGDGKMTIRALIEKHNKRAVKTVGIFKIRIDKEVREKSKLEKLSMDSVPEKNRLVIFRDIASMATGGTAIDKTGKVSPFFKEIVESAANIFGLNRAGIDLITEDISSNDPKAKYAIIELNSDPGIMFHGKPVIIGRGVDVVKKTFLAYMNC
ncbi:MAG: hypothetical protein U9M90_02550 [Patescibacteria group bacterium]|nr:hypothetical protein [Patescibacteria group bacterium]